MHDILSSKAFYHVLFNNLKVKRSKSSYKNPEIYLNYWNIVELTFIIYFKKICKQQLGSGITFMMEWTLYDLLSLIVFYLRYKHPGKYFLMITLKKKVY